MLTFRNRRVYRGLMSLLAASMSSACSPTRSVSVDAMRWTSAFSAESRDAVPLTVVRKRCWSNWIDSQPSFAREWLESVDAARWRGGRWTAVPSPDGGLDRVVVAVSDPDDVHALGALPRALPPKNFKLEVVEGSDKSARAAALSWALGAYGFDALKGTGSPKPKKAVAKLCWPCEGEERREVERAATATYLCRDLITTPCEQLGPADLQAAAEELFEKHGGTTQSVIGDALLSQNFPQIHAVGRATARGREPRLVECAWGREGAPEVALIGKGVCFDTGGLDIKPASAMLTMKKDMGGAAHVLGLASMIMESGLDIRLRVLLPAVENAIAGDAFRPGDVLTARNGKTSEIGNTDAEGRLILADALVYASEAKPDLIVDMATLTGASRVALGADVPSIFSNDDDLARELQDLSKEVKDQVWHLPLWGGYRSQLRKSAVADLKNIGQGGYGGAITAALYLEEFVGVKNDRKGAGEDADDGEDDGAAGGKDGKPAWLHMDVMAYNQASRPGRPEGGEAQGMRAFYALLEKRYGKKD